jgi:hypothetical protein
MVRQFADAIVQIVNVRRTGTILDLTVCIAELENAVSLVWPHRAFWSGQDSRPNGVNE